MVMEKELYLKQLREKRLARAVDRTRLWLKEESLNFIMDAEKYYCPLGKDRWYLTEEYLIGGIIFRDGKYEYCVVNSDKVCEGCVQLDKCKSIWELNRRLKSFIASDEFGFLGKLMVRNGFLEILSSCNPSEVLISHWIEAVGPKGVYPNKTDYSGKWLVFVRMDYVDEVWKKIKEATEKGLLSDRSKVSTIKPSPLRAGSKQGVICIYTYDYRDREDVMRIRKALRELGITNKIPYKPDLYTHIGKYGSGASVYLSDGTEDELLGRDEEGRAREFAGV